MAMIAAASITHDRGFHINPKNFKTLLSCITQHYKINQLVIFPNGGRNINKWFSLQLSLFSWKIIPEDIKKTKIPSRHHKKKRRQINRKARKILLLLDRKGETLNKKKQYLLLLKLVVPKNDQPLLSSLRCEPISVAPQCQKNLFKRHVLLQSKNYRIQYRRKKKRHQNAKAGK